MLSFKTEKQRREWESDRVAETLRYVVYATMGYLSTNGRDLILTEVFRTEGVKGKSRTHDEGRAVDVSIKYWSFDEITETVNWINNTFKTNLHFRSGRAMEIAIQHNSGYGEHIHIQVPTGFLFINTEPTIKHPLV